MTLSNSRIFDWRYPHSMMLLFAALINGSKSNEMQQMKIESKKQENASIVIISGRMDVVSALEYEKFIGGLMQKGDKNFVIDLGGLEYVSSAGLRSFLTTAKKIKEAQGWMRFSNIKGLVKEVFSISGFDSLLSTFTSIEEALRAK